MGKIEFDHTGSGGGITLSSDGTDLLVGGSAVGGGGSAFDTPEVKTASWSVTNSDKGKVFIVDTDNLTLTLPEDSTLDSDWFIRIYTKGNSFQPSYGQVGDLTIDPQYSLHSGRVNGNTEWIMRARQGGILFVDPEASNNFIFDTHSTNWDIDVNSTSNANRANATGWGSIAISGQASAQATGSIAIGYLSTASGSDSIALGGNSATATATDAIALGNSRAAGANSFAAAINAASTAYGATTATAISIGCLAKAGATAAVAIGAGSLGVGNNSVSIGKDSQSCQQGGTAVGWKARNYTNDAVAIGRDACTHATGGIAIGESYAAGSNSIAIGNKCCTGAFGTTGNCAISIGVETLAATVDSVALGHCVFAGTGTSPTAIGFKACASGIEPLAVGSCSCAIANYSTAVGSLAIAGTSATVGQRSVAIGKSYTAGNDSFAAVIGNNSTSYGATNCEGIAMGWLAKAGHIGAIAIGGCNLVTNTRGTAIGCGNTISGSTGLALGADHCVSGSYAAALGGYCTCSAATYTTTFGPFSCASVQNSFVYGAKAFFEIGGAQGGTYLLWADTTDATSEILNSSGGTAGATNQIVASTDTAVTFDGTITAIKQGGAEYGSWKIEGLLVNDGGTTTLPNSIITTIHNNFGWNLAVGPDNTNNALNITVTGAASTNIRWLANIRTTEITYA